MAHDTSDDDLLKEAHAEVAITATELQAAQQSYRDREDRYLAAQATLHAIKARVYQS